MNLYKKMFSQVLNEADEALPPVDAAGDAQQFEQGFENPEAYQQVQDETDATVTPVEDKTATIEAAEKYSDIILNKIIPLLDKIQNEFLQGGIFANSGITPPNMSSITTNLASLAQELPSKLKDVAAKEASKSQKNK